LSIFLYGIVSWAEAIAAQAKVTKQHNNNFFILIFFSGEINFFPEDPEGSTGDHQQFNKGDHMQQRGYNVGWLDQGRIVSPLPGRVVVYDGRCLHNANSPTSTPKDPPLWRIAFRARRK
jgi:hypothetical protein